MTAAPVPVAGATRSRRTSGAGDFIRQFSRRREGMFGLAILTFFAILTHDRRFERQDAVTRPIFQGTGLRVKIKGCLSVIQVIGVIFQFTRHGTRRCKSQYSSF